MDLSFVADEFPDFFVLELEDGWPRIRVNLGDGEVVLRLDGNTGTPTLNDGDWHTIEYFYDKQVCPAVDILNVFSHDVSEGVEEFSDERDEHKY